MGSTVSTAHIPLRAPQHTNLAILSVLLLLRPAPHSLLKRAPFCAHMPGLGPILPIEPHGRILVVRIVLRLLPFPLHKFLKAHGTLLRLLRLSVLRSVRGAGLPGFGAQLGIVRSPFARVAERLGDSNIGIGRYIASDARAPERNTHSAFPQRNSSTLATTVRRWKNSQVLEGSVESRL